MPPNCGPRHLGTSARSRRGLITLRLAAVINRDVLGLIVPDLDNEGTALHEVILGLRTEHA